MNYEYVKDHKIPIVLEKETGFYVRIDQINWRLATAIRSKNDHESETDREAYYRIKEWIKENHPEIMI